MRMQGWLQAGKDLAMILLTDLNLVFRLSKVDSYVWLPSFMPFQLSLAKSRFVRMTKWNVKQQLPCSDFMQS